MISKRKKILFFTISALTVLLSLFLLIQKKGFILGKKITIDNLKVDKLDDLDYSPFLKSDTSDYLTGSSTKLYFSWDASSEDYYIDSSANAVFKTLNADSWKQYS